MRTTINHTKPTLSPKLARGVRKSRYKGRPCYRWHSIGANGEPLIRRVFTDTPHIFNPFGFPEGEQGPYEQVK